MCSESVPALPRPGHEGGILAERLAFLPHPHPWPCMSRPLLGCDRAGVGGEPALDFLPSCRISPPWGGIFRPNGGYGPSHPAACTGLYHIWGRASLRRSSLRFCICYLQLSAVCLFQVFTDGVTPWSISSHCSALCLIRELNGLDRIKAFSW